MKNIIFGATMLVATLFFGSMSAAQDIRSLDANGNGIYEEGEVNPCQEYVSGPAQCTYPVTKFKKCTYCTQRCVEEPYTEKKKCCRYVNQYYTKTCCRNVPQYYTKTYCRKVPEYYCVDVQKCRKKYVTDEHCYYKPYTECRTATCEVPCQPACAPVDNCASGSCSR